MSCDCRPSVVEEELRRIHQTGFNLVGIIGPPQWSKEKGSSYDFLTPKLLDNLRDFMSRAKANGLLVIIGLLQTCCAGMKDKPPPTDQMVNEYVKRIKDLNLINDPALLGYDLTFGELNLGNRAQGFRQHLNDEWTKWVLSKYGSIEAAKAEWAYEPQILSTSPLIISDPEDSQLSSEGAWSKYVTDYWSFVYDWTNSYFKPVVQAIKKVDPNHLVTIKNGRGGTGSLGHSPEKVAPDTSIGADFLDFLSPEGYAIPPAWLVGPVMYKNQVAGVYCKDDTSGVCTPEENVWDNPSDEGLDLAVITRRADADDVDPSLWPSPPAFTPSPGTVSGRVFRVDNGQPVAHVMVGTCTGADVYTDANGYYQFPISPGERYCVGLTEDYLRIFPSDVEDIFAINGSPSLYEEYTKTALAWFGFIHSYTKWATAYTKPVVWLENGRTLGLYPMAKTLDEQKQVWQDFLAAALEYDSDGYVAWSNFGGPRTDERADYGLFNSDGSPRPVIQAFQWYFSQLGVYKPRPVDTYVEVEHGSRNPRGFGGEMDKHLAEFDQLLRDGRKPAVRFTMPHSPTIALSPSVGPAATTVAVTGSGWSDQDTSVTFQITSSPNGGELWNPPATFTCQISKGSIASGCSFAVKPGALGGAYGMKITGSQNDWTAAEFTVQSVAETTTTGIVSMESSTLATETTRVPSVGLGGPSLLYFGVMCVLLVLGIAVYWRRKSKH
jgi:hypothetical protein